jgi:hypothetical protein
MRNRVMREKEEEEEDEKVELYGKRDSDMEGM